MLKGTTFHALKRYTAFEELDHALRLTLPVSFTHAVCGFALNNAHSPCPSYSDHAHVTQHLQRTLRSSIPRLPPKAPFAKFRPAFLDRRRQHLQFWLARVLLHPEIGKTEVVKRWVVS